MRNVQISSLKTHHPITHFYHLKIPNLYPTFCQTHGLTRCNEYKWLPTCGKEPLQFYVLLITLFFLQPQYPNSPNLEAPFITSILIHSPNPEALITSFLHQTQIRVLPHVHTSTKTIQEHQKVENQHIFISKHK